MKYYLDTEFIEGFHKPMFGKRRHFIDLISIGIVAEDGRTYYAISNEFDPKDADDWVKENVISKLPNRHFTGTNMNEVKLWKSNKQIRQDIISFVCDYAKAAEYSYLDGLDVGMERYLKENPPEFYAYYADYDWVVFCSLFGRMIDLPKGYPMYCRDLKQMIDEKADSLTSEQASRVAYPGVTHNVFTYLDSTNDKSFKLDALKMSPKYPKQYDAHNALDDAHWNQKLHQFIINLNK